MRIIIASDAYYPYVDGASKFTQRLVKNLKERHEILVIAPSANTKTTLIKINGVKTLGVQSLYIFAPHNFRAPIPVNVKNKIRKTIKNFNPDIIHVQGHIIIPRVVIKIASEEKIPIIGTNHFMPENLIHYLHLPHPIEKKVINLSWKDLKRVFKDTNIITTPTQTAANLLTNVGIKKEIYSISCGVDLNRFNPKKKSAKMLTKYKLPKVPILIYLGRLDKEKNIDFILKAVSKVSPKVSFHLAIAGEGAEKKKLQNLTKTLNIQKRVTFLGFVPNKDLPILLASSDCFVIGSIAELQSIATMEAMASGLPVLAANAVALPELCHNNQNGYLFNPKSPKSLSQKIIKIFSDKKMRNKMAKESLKIIQKHDIKKTISAYEKLYKKVIKQNK